MPNMKFFPSKPSWQQAGGYGAAGAGLGTMGGSMMGGGMKGAGLGALSGGLTGFAGGGPWGGALGALGGGLGGYFAGGGGGGESQQGREQQFQRFTPEQQQVLNQLLQQGSQGMDFGPIEQREKRRFEEETIPGLAERFTAMGGGAQESSAFQGALGGAGADLSERLAALRSQFGGQQLGMGLTPQYESAYFPRQPGFGEQALGGGMQGLMALLPLLLAGRGQ